MYIHIYMNMYIHIRSRIRLKKRNRGKMVRDIVRNTFWGCSQGFQRHLKSGFQKHLKEQKEAGCQAVPKAAHCRGTEAAISKSLTSVMQPQWECCRVLQGAAGCCREL